MARPSHPPNLAALGFGSELDEMFRRANPNPTREGCPSPDVLAALARRERPIGDLAYEHLIDCSPCYIDVREMQRAHVIASQDRSSQPRWIGAAAVAVLVAAVGVWWLALRRGTAALPTERPAPLQVTLDLRPDSVTRRSTAGNFPPPIELPRGVVELTLLLPVGAEPGLYDVHVQDGTRRSLAFAQGEGIVRNVVTTLQATLDLSGVTSGSYRLAVLTPADDWLVVPVKVYQRP
jgi:hypothetical protein